MNEVCSLPRELAPGTPIADLGSGSWARTRQSEAETEYGCQGGAASTTLEEPGLATTIYEYAATGGPEYVNDISVKYSAVRSNGLDGSEMERRQAYVDFVDKISMRIFNQPLPDSAKSGLLETKDIKKVNPGMPVGTGYVGISVNVRGDKYVNLHFHFRFSLPTSPSPRPSPSGKAMLFRPLSNHPAAMPPP